MKVKTSELIGPPLDYAAGLCEGHNVVVLTVEEQRQRYIDVDALDVGCKKSAEEWDTYFAASAKPKICILTEDGYKRAPNHSEAIMLWGEGAPVFQYSESWSQGGPIIGREEMAIGKSHEDWLAAHPRMRDGDCVHGPTALVAAMRCYVASKLGDEVDIPEELL